ncbi:permease-like cell division protein FtsX [Caproiciproducens sp. LBM24188]|jgi:cell division transport system permease protein|nr:ABC transporter permease [Oscillospiraceae bacterium]HHV31025.1 ABC transporter permease [Clostridiales bacterium]
MKIRNLKYLGIEGIKNIWINRTMSFASIGVLVSCLLLTGAAVLFSLNIDTAMKTIEGTNSIRVYMKQGLPTLTAVKAGEEIKKLDNISSCEFIPKDEAIQKYMDILGDEDGTMLSGMTGKDNPLPDAFKVSFKDLSQYKQTAEQIKKISGVDTINDYSDVAQKLTNLDRMVTTAGSWVIVLLSLVSLFIISNTIRVTMFSRRLEISIMKSVGATNWFVRVPFIVEGMIIGLISGGVASLLLHLIYQKLMSSITSILLFSPIDISLLSWRLTLIFLLAGTLFGAFGGMISIGKYLKKEGGEIVGW